MHIQNSKSFNHAIAETTINTFRKIGHEVIFHDLYAEKFNPILSCEELLTECRLDDNIKKHCEDLASSGSIIIIHPGW